MSQARNWMFTLNNPSDLIMKPNQWPDVKFVVWQLEKAPETGTLHWQGFISFHRPRRINWLKRYCSRTAHFEVRKGTFQQAYDYCTKSDSRVEGPWEFGEKPSPGKRTDLEELKVSLDAEMSLRDLASEHFHPFLRYARGIQMYRRLKAHARSSKTNVTVVYGETGVGKSRAMQTCFPGAYWKTTGDKWWDDYDFEETVIIDEFYGWLPYAYFLRLLDRYPMYVETKGGMVNFTANRIVLAANNPPDLWYNWSDKMTFAPLERRIDNLLHMGNNGEITVIKGENVFEKFKPVNEVPFELETSPIAPEVEVGISDLYCYEPPLKKRCFSGDLSQDSKEEEKVETTEEVTASEEDSSLDL